MSPGPAPGRRGGLIAILGLAFILAMTLTPQPQNVEQVARTPLWCLRCGDLSGMDIILNRIPNAISIPAKALFTHAGKPTVYLQTKSDYRRVEVKVQARNPDEVAVTGLPAGSLVALVDVEKKDQKK